MNIELGKCTFFWRPRNVANTVSPAYNLSSFFYRWVVVRLM